MFLTIHLKTFSNPCCKQPRWTGPPAQYTIFEVEYYRVPSHCVKYASKAAEKGACGIHVGVIEEIPLMFCRSNDFCRIICCVVARVFFAREIKLFDHRNLVLLNPASGFVQCPSVPICLPILFRATEDVSIYKLNRQRDCLPCCTPPSRPHRKLQTRSSAFHWRVPDTPNCP